MGKRSDEWGTMELTILRMEFPKKTTAEVAARLKRSISAVSNKANELGLKKQRYGIEWTPQMLKLLKDHFPRMFNRDLAKLIGVSQRTLIRKARELGYEKMEGFLDIKRRAINERCGAKGPNATSFKPGSEVGKEYRFKPGHVESEESKRKRSETMKAIHKKKKLLKSLGLKTSYK